MFHDAICTIRQQSGNPWIYFFFSELLLAFVFVYWVKSIKSSKIERTLKILSSIALLVSFFIASFVSLFVAALFDEEYSQPIAAKYFILDAAIKNTCFLDPNKVHCPHTLQELIYIQDKDFNKLLSGVNARYQYYPETNNYSLVIQERSGKAVIFDSRLSKNDPNSLDFKEVGSIGCGDILKVTDPPNFSGPWQPI